MSNFWRIFAIWFHCVAVAKAWKKPSNKSFWQRPIENEKLFAAVASVVLALKQLKPTFYFLFNFTPTGSAIIFGSKTVLQMFSQMLFFAGNHGNNEIWVPSMPPHHLSLIFIGMKQKKCFSIFELKIGEFMKCHFFKFTNFQFLFSQTFRDWSPWKWCKGCLAFLKKIISDLKRLKMHFISPIYIPCGSGLACDVKEEII